MSLIVGGVSVREYQARAVDESRALVAKGHRRILLQQATGSGKTTVAAAMIGCCVQKGLRALFLAPARELVEQCSAKLAACGIHHGIIMPGHGYTRSNVQVASKDCLYSRHQRELITLPPANLVIYDEAHGSVAACANALLKRYPEAVIYGLTATPARLDGKGLGDFYTAMVQTSTLRELISQGYLVPFRSYAPYRPNMKGVPVRMGDYLKGPAASKVDTPTIVGDVVRWWKRLGEDRLTFCYAASVAHSQHLRESFLASGIQAAHVDGKTPTREREDTFERFRSGDVRILCNYGVAVLGVDIPEAGCCILARPTKSTVVYRQAVGRVMRPHEGKKYAILLDHAGCVFLHGMPDEDVPWTLSTSERVQDKVAERMTKNEASQPICCDKCHCLFRGRPTCPECGWKVPLKKRKPVKENKNGVLSLVKDAGGSRLEYDRLRRIWLDCLGLAAIRDYTVSQAAAIFKNRSGLAPWSVHGLPLVPEPQRYREKVVDLFPEYSWGKKRRSGGAT